MKPLYCYFISKQFDFQKKITVIEVEVGGWFGVSKLYAAKYQNQ